MTERYLVTGGAGFIGANIAAALSKQPGADVVVVDNFSSGDWKNLVHVAPYLSGANVDDPHQFMGSLGQPREWSFRNYYLDRYFSEERLFRGTLIGSIGLLVLMFFVEHL